MVNWLYGNSALCHLALCNLALRKLALCNLAPCNLALCNLALCHSALCHWALCNLALRNLARYCLPRAGGFQKAGDAGDVDDAVAARDRKKNSNRPIATGSCPSRTQKSLCHEGVCFCKAGSCNLALRKMALRNLARCYLARASYFTRVALRNLAL